MTKTFTPKPFSESDFKAFEGLVTASPEDIAPRVWIDTMYAPLNYRLSGNPTTGFASGRITEIAGPSASGKTLIAQLAMIAAQRMGGAAIFVDWERAYSLEFAAKLGMNLNAPYFFYIRPETWEEGNTKAMKIAKLLRDNQYIAPTAPIVAVFDSVAAAVPRSVLYDNKGNRRDIEEHTMNDTTALARVTSSTLKVINQLVGDFDVTAIYLNQIRTKVGVVYGDPRTTPGGAAMEYYASVRLFTGMERIYDKGTKELIGTIVKMQTKKNKLTRPLQEVELRLMYSDDGMINFDFTTGYLEELVKLGAVEKSGSYLVWEGKKIYMSELAKKINAEGKFASLVEMYVQKRYAVVDPEPAKVESEPAALIPEA